MAIVPLSKAEITNLRFVCEGTVNRIYRADGNVVKGGHSATIRRLEARGLVREAGIGGHARVAMILTDAGRRALAGATNDRA